MAKLSEGGSKGLAVFAVVLMSIGIIVGPVLYVTLHTDTATLAVQRTSAEVDCIPEGNGNIEICEHRGCRWMYRPAGSLPNCTYSTDKSFGYRVKGIPVIDLQSYTFTLERDNTASLFHDDINEIKLEISCQLEHRIRVKFYDPNNKRYEVPLEALDIENSTINCNETLYNVTYPHETDTHFGIQITRISTGAVIFDTTVPGFTFSNQYLQLTTLLPSANLYGFGEHVHRQFKHNMNYKKWSIFTQGESTADEWNLYGAHPFYMNLEVDGNANGVFLKNSNAMDIVLQPDPFPAISYRVIGGILDFYIFLGPTPENVVQQYTGAVGRPVMPSYWSLGFQLSRWNYDNLTHVKEVVERNRLAEIPYDVQYGDIDYMFEKLDFTYDHNKYNGLPQFIEELHQNGQKYIIILDPGIGSNRTIHAMSPPNNSYPAFEDGLEKNVYVRDGRSGNHSFNGFLQAETAGHKKVWPGAVVFPDFTHPNATNYWKTWADDFHNQQNITFDGLWIDMNEPKSFQSGSLTGCEKNKWNFPPYVPNIFGKDPDGRMFHKTICMDAIQSWGKHYDVHSLYGHSQSIVTFNALRQLLPEKRPFVLTRSSFSGTGKYAGHWLGDNQSQWRHLPWSITGMLEFSLFGFPYIGADICGFWYATTEELCKRWMLLGAFYPFARNHNAKGFRDQDPAAFGEDMIRISKSILRTRYKLLPYLYTLFHYAHIDGSTVARPLLHEFPTDQNTWSVDKQFLWGSALLISPALSKGQIEVNAYFPKSRWYDYFESGKELSATGTSHKLNTPIDKINLHIRGGYIIPWQEPANTTVYSRQKPMGIIIALDDNSNANGTLFWDDGERYDSHELGYYLMVKFVFMFNKLEIGVQHNNYTKANNLQFDTVQVWGLRREPKHIKVDTVTLDTTKRKYNPFYNTLMLLSVGLNVTGNHTVTWTYD